MIVIFVYVHRWLAPPANPASTRGRQARGRPLRRAQCRATIPLAAHFLTGSILTLALPLGVLIVVAVWYALMLRGGAGER